MIISARLSRLAYQRSRPPLHTPFVFIRQFSVEQTPDIEISDQKCLEVCIMGSPNAGKSSLLNQLVGQEVSIVSRKRNTTRKAIVGYFTDDKVQVVFTDSPGYIHQDQKSGAENRPLQQAAVTSGRNKDIIMVVVDAAKTIRGREVGRFEDMIHVANKNIAAGGEVVLVLNKCDLVHPKSRLLDITSKLVESYNNVIYGPDKHKSFDMTVFMISALKGNGVEDVKNYLKLCSRPKSWLFHPNSCTTLTDKDRINDIVRKHLLDNVHSELPYQSTIITKSISPLSSSNGVRIDVDIIVPKAHYIRMIVGHQGRTLLAIRRGVCKDAEAILNQQQVMVYLWVKLDGNDNDQAQVGIQDNNIESRRHSAESSSKRKKEIDDLIVDISRKSKQ